MVETFGANRGITPPMRKGIKGSDIRYNVNDGLNGDYGSPKDAQWRFEAKARARVMDLQHYLGEEWIDYKAVNYYVNSKKSRDGGQSMVASKVFRCVNCKVAYETKSTSAGGRLEGNRKLPDVVFDNVPLHKGECGLCG
tara:strand:+ start:53 stop:469 length:417 start_codon:yes stop_codon:yes gene_type:complete